jgi:hypothetical protein
VRRAAGLTSTGVLLAALAGPVAGCDAEAPGQLTGDVREGEPQENWARDVVATHLDVDLATHTATARVTLAPHARRGASLEVQGLHDLRVTTPDGRPVPHRVVDGRLDLAIPARQEVEVDVAYAFGEQPRLEGLTARGTTFLWPTFCGNLFPCKSDPADGVRLSLEVTGGAQTLVFPARLDADAPSYVLAWAEGDYRRLDLGATGAGTRVAVFHRPDEEGAALEGTEPLLDAFDWLETTYGAYLFGSEVGSVSVDWGAGAFGGMEHHPYWHVSRDSMADAETHVHEAVHGWFGDGVRIACWEDLVLSEGTTSYVTARALEAVRGAAAGEAVWASYDARLDAVVASDDRVARPDGCGEVDVLRDLWNDVVYVKGAFFYRAVEAAIGRDAMDRVLARFYAEHGGGAASVDDMLAAIEEETGFDPGPLADRWLRALGRPDR